METNMPIDIAPKERLIVALDVDTAAEATHLVKVLGDDVGFYKVGLQLFMTSGIAIAQALGDRGKKVFLDLKINDTPRTVETAVRMAANAHVRLFTLQGNAATCEAAKRGRGDQATPKFLQVTYLSSWDAEDLREYFHLDRNSNVDIDEEVIKRSAKLLASGCDGVIASGSSVARLRAMHPNLIIVTPGIRPSGSTKDDHKRSLTPAEAIHAGADYLVVGRPIRDAADPKGAAEKIQTEIAQAYANKAA
jgi:orotidine-5'-phosphate decarboxylase